MKRTALVILLLALPVVAVLAQPARPEPELPGWVRQRLATLTPTDPMAYFELGEEVSYEVTSRLGRDLARTLFVLAYQLDPELGPHTCLALADLTASIEERQWLLAMAESMGSRDARPWSATGGARSDSRTAQDARRRLAEGLRALRAEDGRPMRDAMNSAAVTEYLARLEQSEPRVYSAINAAAQAAAGANGCPRCRSQRAVNEGGTRRGRVICTRCVGNPGAALSESEMLQSLRVESRLRDAEPRTWSAVLLAQEDRPLRDIRADDLARNYSVDPQQTLWSEDQGWHAPPAAEP